MSAPGSAEQGIRWVRCSTHRYLPVGWPHRFKRELVSAIDDHENVILHDAGIWLPSNRYVAAVARKLGIPRMVSPRGMLSDWALNHSGWRKKVVWRLHQKRDLESASMLHATAAEEAEEFRSIGLCRPIAVIPNGVDLPSVDDRARCEPRTWRTALFLSRLHPKKGLLDLIAAWAVVQPAGWRLVIAGDDEGGYRRVVEDAVNAAQRENEIEFVGAVADAEKWNLYARADLFILPSYSENFGIVIAEALAAGVPVITTRATPWMELERNDCGWWIEVGTAPLISALHEATSATDGRRRAMGDRGRDLVKMRYSWGLAAEKMLACYRWLLGQEEKPDCVSLPDAN